MLRRMTSGWTELHLPLTGAILVAGMASWTAAASGGATGLAVVVVIAVVGLVALLADAFFGIVAGLLGAAAAVFAITVTHAEHLLADAALHAATAVLVLVFGALTGSVGEGIRRGRRRAERTAAGALAPAQGSLGLMSAPDAHLRLEEEIIRAQLHARPLSLAAVHMTAHDDGLSPENLRRAQRAVARVLDTELRPTDVPFAGDHAGEFGVIMVETEADAAGDVLESALILARDAKFTDRDTGKRRYVGDVAFVLLGVAEVCDKVNSPESVLAATRSDLAALPAWSEA